ncbi:MAG TPA: hypothetical protein VGX51_04530 [Solirubrobacteraceae bacterium]|jgi:hypothetical protein|nr:hypothetical protein [Solirubrobacteraceae bacterium]
MPEDPPGAAGAVVAGGLGAGAEEVCGGGAVATGVLCVVLACSGPLARAGGAAGVAGATVVAGVGAGVLVAACVLAGVLVTWACEPGEAGRCE